MSLNLSPSVAISTFTTDSCQNHTKTNMNFNDSNVVPSKIVLIPSEQSFQNLMQFEQMCDTTSTECDTTTNSLPCNISLPQLEHKTPNELIRDLILLTAEYQRVTLMFHEERNKAFKLESENEFLQEECDSLEDQLVETEKTAEKQIKEQERQFEERLRLVEESGRSESETTNSLKVEIKRASSEIEQLKKENERKDDEVRRLNQKLKLAHDTNLLLQQIINEKSAGL